VTTRLVRLPDSEGPDITIERGAFGAPRVLVDGQAIPRAADGTYSIPQSDGTTQSIRYKSTFAGQWLELEDGRRLALDTPAPKWLRVLMLLPIGLVAVGGLIGGAIGGLGVGVNLGITRTALPRPVQAAAMVGVLALAAGAWWIVGTTVRNTFSPLETYGLGDCVANVPVSGADVSGIRSVSCDGEHNGEIVGVNEHPDGDFPGVPAIEATAESVCRAAFLSYVGTSYETSRLGMFYLYPSSDTWGAGDRQIACLALAPPGELLSGSIAGTGQ